MKNKIAQFGSQEKENIGKVETVCPSGGAISAKSGKKLETPQL